MDFAPPAGPLLLRPLFRWWKSFDEKDICRPLRSPPIEESRTTDILHLRSFLDLHVTFVPGRRIYDDAAS